MAGVLVGIMTVETQGLGILMASMTGWSVQQGALAGGVVGILYVILAGMKEIGYLNVINAAVKYGGLILATLFLAFTLPGGNFDTVESFYKTSGQAHMLSVLGTPAVFGTFVLGTLVAVVFSQSINQMLLQPAMAARDETVIRRAMWIAAPVNGMFGVFAVVIGLTAKSLPEYQVLGPKVAATTMLVDRLPPWLAALLLASFLTAVLSTFAMACLAPATLFSLDIYKRLYRPDAGEAEVRRVTQATIVVLGVAAMGVATALPPILAAMTWLFSWLVPVFWVVVFGLFWKRSGPIAIATLLAAWAANCLWSFSPISEWLGAPADANAYVALAVTLAVGVLGNLATRGQPALFAPARGAA
jgi:SSS family solute:Na+ symporter